MKESVLSNVSICKHCGKAFLINIEGENEECDVCVDSQVPDAESDITTTKYHSSRFESDCI